jgi:hypothetical protein
MREKKKGRELPVADQGGESSPESSETNAEERE